MPLEVGKDRHAEQRSRARIASRGRCDRLERAVPRYSLVSAGILIACPEGEVASLGYSFVCDISIFMVVKTLGRTDWIAAFAWKKETRKISCSSCSDCTDTADHTVDQ